METELVILIIVYVLLGGCYAMGFAADGFVMILAFIFWPLILMYCLGTSHARFIIGEVKKEL